MQRWLGSIGVPVVAVGLLRSDVQVVGAGLSFLLGWYALSQREPRRRPRPRS